MKAIFSRLCSFFAPRPAYLATMYIAGKTISHPICAPDYSRARQEALRILDDQGQLLSLTSL